MDSNFGESRSFSPTLAVLGIMVPAMASCSSPPEGALFFQWERKQSCLPEVAIESNTPCRGNQGQPTFLKRSALRSTRKSTAPSHAGEGRARPTRRDRAADAVSPADPSKRLTQRAYTERVLRRFWSHVRRGSQEACWSWKGYLKRGQGRFHMGGRGGTTISAHRFAWTLAHGPVDATLEVIHTCETNSCVNPRHLFVGTAAERGAEAFRKGQTPFGERHHKAKLTAGKVANIRALAHASPRPTVHQAAAMLGLSPEHVSAIWKFKIWTRVGGAAIPFEDVRSKRPRRRPQRSWAPCSPSLVAAIRALKGGIFSQREVGQLFGVTQATVSRIWRRP